MTFECGTWRQDRWKNTREEADAEVAAFLARWPGSLMGDPMWPGPGPQPRTCSYDGGIHPDDAIALLQSGEWRVVPTSKSYKMYMERNDGKLFIPPVKVYVNHFDDDQIKRFNAAALEAGVKA